MRIDDHIKVTDLFRSDFNHFTFEATKLNEEKCELTFDKCMSLILDSRNTMENPEPEMVLLRNQMRMYSFKQLFNMFTVINNKSQVQDRVCVAEDQIKDLYT